jgi:hypothetical protein
MFRSLLFISRVIVTALAVTFLVADVSSANEQEASPVTPVVGSFGIGSGVSGEVDERTGGFALQVPLMELPGVISATGSSGAVSIGVSYSQELAGTGIDRFGLGVGFQWSEGTYVDVDGGV